jgi:hypothetical protein
LPTSICSPERSPQVKKAIKPAREQNRAKKSLGFKGKGADTDSVIDELNIEELIDKSTTQLKVLIVYPSGCVKTKSTFHEVTKSLILNLTHGHWKTVANGVFKHPNLRCELTEPLMKVVAGEFKEYCSDSFDSILKKRDPVDLAAFSNKLLVHEAEVLCPFWMSCLRGACDVPSAKDKMKSMRCRNHKMSAVAYRVSAILFHSGVRFNDIERLQKLGICMSPDSIVGMEKKMGENCEAKLKVWKKDIEKNTPSMLLLNEVKEKQIGLHKEDDMQ